MLLLSLATQVNHHYDMSQDSQCSDRCRMTTLFHREHLLSRNADEKVNEMWRNRLPTCLPWLRLSRSISRVLGHIDPQLILRTYQSSRVALLLDEFPQPPAHRLAQ